MDSLNAAPTRSFSPLKSPTLQRHLRENIDIKYPERFLARRRHSFSKESLIGKDNFFRCAVDIHDFTRNEVKVSTLGHTLLIKASHEEKEDDHGLVTRNFTKKYVLPYDLDVDRVQAWISKDILYVKIPPKTEEIAERFINITLEET